MNDSLSFSKPAVFVCSAVIALSIAILSFPERYPIILMLAVIAAGIMFVIMFANGSKGAAFFLGTLIILGATVPYISYISNEKYAGKVLEILKDKEYTFSGEIVHTSSSSRPVNARIKVFYTDGRKVRKPFYVQVTSFSGDLPEKGDSIVFKGMLSSVNSSDSTEFDTKTYLRSKNTFIQVSDAEFISNSINENSSPLDILRSKYEKAVHTYVTDNYSYKAASIVKALTLADKTDFSKSMSETFAKSGLSHLMCVSGLHLCVLLGMITSLLNALILHKNVRCALLIGFSVFYIVFTGASPSVIRAGIMACFTYTAAVVGRRNNSLIALFASGALMTLCSPYVVLDISAKLSFVSTLGVILMWNVSESLFGFLKSKSRFVYGILNALLVNTGAVALTLPLSSNIFGGFSTVSIPATLATNLVCETLIVISNILCVLSLMPFAGFICSALGNICTMLSLYILNTAEWFSNLKYSYVEADDVHIIFIAFAIFLSLISLLISFGASKAIRALLLAVVVLSVTMSVTGVVHAINKDKRLCVSYYRKNKDDRQLSVKLGTYGYLIFNADDILCTNPDKSRFDKLSGKNHIVVIPDKNTDTYILSENILSFSSRYGISGVLVPDTPYGFVLSEKLSDYGIDCHIFPEKFQIDKFTVDFSYDTPNVYTLCVSDGKDEVFAVFADKYQKEHFDGHHDVCAYFTRETKTQFSPDSDTPPDCKIFFTRAEKGFAADRIFNTFGKTSFDLKE